MERTGTRTVKRNVFYFDLNHFVHRGSESGGDGGRLRGRPVDITIDGVGKQRDLQAVDRFALPGLSVYGAAASQAFPVCRPTNLDRFTGRCDAGPVVVYIPPAAATSENPRHLILKSFPVYFLDIS